MIIGHLVDNFFHSYMYTNTYNHFNSDNLNMHPIFLNQLVDHVCYNIIESLSYLCITYRVFIKYCVFSKNL